MPSYNRVIFIGHLTRDPQLKYLPSQTAVAEFGMACNRKFKVGEEQREEVTFIDCTAFGKQAEVLNQYMKKGKPLLIEGRLKYDQWDDKNGGGKRSKLIVVVESFQFLGGPRDDEGGDDQRQDYPRNRQTVASGKVSREEALGEESHFNPDDLPF